MFWNETVTIVVSSGWRELSTVTIRSVIGKPDSKGKILCYDMKGTYRWEDRPGKIFNKILGQQGDTFYLTSTLFEGQKADLLSALFTWKRGGKPFRLLQRPVVFLRTDAIVGNERIKGGGFFYISSPVYAMNSDQIIAAASRQYCFDFFDLKGNPQGTTALKAPPPEKNETLARWSLGDKMSPYAIMDIFVLPADIAVVSNYFKNYRPRIEFFSKKGEYRQSYLLPFKVDGQANSIRIQNNFVVYMNQEYSGFKIFRLNN